MKKRYEYLSPDLTPLIDVVFILLIFFIVTSSFKSDKFALDLTLPNSASKQKVINKKQINIEVNKKYIAFMGEKVKLIDLQKHLEKIKDKTKSININIDQDVPYKKVIEVLDILQLNSLNNIAFITKEK